MEKANITEFVYNIRKQDGKNELRFVPPSIIVLNEYKMYNIIKKHERAWIKLLKKEGYRIRLLAKSTCKKVRGIKGFVVSLCYTVEDM